MTATERRHTAVAELTARINAMRAARGERPILGPHAEPLTGQFARDLRGDHDGPHSYRVASR